jgi:hypothetical protein
MPAIVHGGSLGRWFEELCRIKHVALQEIVSSAKTQLMPGCLPNEGGVYAFWWTGERQLLKPPACNPKLTLIGPGGRGVALELTEEWLGLPADLPVPLYLGKTTSGIRNRLRLHLMLPKQRILPLNGGAKKAKPPTTSCQLRAGIEHLFPSAKDTRTIVLQNVGLSYVILGGDDNAANRFYLEDLAIGLMRPPLNVDIER